MTQEARMRCQQVTRYLSAFGDGELPEPLHTRVALHVAECAQCTGRLASYRQLDGLLAGLDVTHPSPHVFENVQLATQAQADPEAVRESLRRERRGEVLRRRLAAVRAPSHEPIPLPSIPTNRRSRVLAGSLSALAVLLLISLAAVAFDRMHVARSVSNVTTPTTQEAGVSVLAQTRDRVNAAQKQLSFIPVLPRYLPAGAHIASVTATPVATGSTSASSYLDITWTFVSGIVCQVHLREAPTALHWPGDSPATADATLSWQLPGSPPWRPLNPLSGSGQPTVGQERVGFTIALDVQPCDVGDSTGDDIAVLRITSLSMDAPYEPMVLASNNGDGQVLHWTEVITIAGGAVLYTRDVYVSADGTDEAIVIRDANRSEISKTIILGSRALQLDPRNARYFSGAATMVGGRAASPSDQVLEIFDAAGSLASQGYLWNLGLTTYDKRQVMAFALVSELTPATAYVSATTSQVTAVQVTLGLPEQPGGPDAQPVFADTPCGTFTLIEYLQQAPTGTFSVVPPRNYVQTGTPLLAPTCSSAG
jgi:hypothetical protein